ncbi:hypothetical protein UQ79_18180, partial [Shigella dysenteriae]|uniref:hypothetical protein n=1 Tax=Shigella dysenteriae TaxID=622 RepID=UPI000EC0FD51
VYQYDNGLLNFLGIPQGKDPVLLVPPQLRPLLARYARLFAPGLHVLSYNEVPDELELKIMGALS